MDNLKVFCIKCWLESNHEIVYNIPETKNYNDITEFNNYQMIKCRWCDSISYRTESSNTEDRSYDEEGEEWLYISSKIYPRRWDELIKKQYFCRAPRIVKVIYNETIEAFNNGLYTLCTAGIRAIIEAICIDKKIKWWLVRKVDNKTKEYIEKYSDKLVWKINSLSNEWLLTPIFASFFHDLRGLWNDAVHQLEIPSMDELKIAIDIIERTLFNIYEIEERREDFESYNTNRKKRLKK